MTPKQMYKYLTEVIDPSNPDVIVDIHKGIREPVGYTDIHFHMGLLRAEAKRNVVEIGVRHGASTCALLSGVEDNGGHLYSIDTEDCSELFKGHTQWTFIQANSSKDAAQLLSFLPAQFDLLFVDGDHTFEGVSSDLMNYGSRAKVILCHDYEPSNNPDVVEAVKQYTELRGLSCEINPASHGLATLR